MNKKYGTYNESPEGKAARFKAWAADNKEHLRNYKKTKEKLYRNPLNNKYMCDLNTREGMPKMSFLPCPYSVNINKN